MSFIERHSTKIFFIICILFLIEGGIYCWRMPKDFRVSMVPKLESQIYNYDRIVDMFKGEISNINTHQKVLIFKVHDNREGINSIARRINMLREAIDSEHEIDESIYLKWYLPEERE